MRNPTPDIVVQWRCLLRDDDSWQSSRCLYAYLAPDEKEILYIGKAWGVTVETRWKRENKEDFWDWCEAKKDLFEHIAMIGEVHLMYAGKLTKELLADTESLLIFYEQPEGNIQSKNSRISRPGLIVKCEGTWSGKYKLYEDV